MKRYLTTEPAFVAGSLLAAGSVITDAEISGERPGSFMVEIDAKGNPKTAEGAELARGIGVSSEPIEISPVAPHAPNPTQPQGLPPHNVGEVAPAGTFVPADGVESDEAAAARTDQAAKPKSSRK